MADGEVKLWEGKVLIGPAGQVATADNCCGGAPCECPCDVEEWALLVATGAPCHGLVQTYRIKDYADYDFVACAECEDSPLSAWNGHVGAMAGARCFWAYVGDCSISGKYSVFPTNPQLYLDTDLCQWIFWVRCTLVGVGSYTIWKGTGPAAATPPGIYTRTEGCDTTSTIEIEEVP